MVGADQSLCELLGWMQRFSAQRDTIEQQWRDMLPMELMDVAWMTSAEEAF